MTDIIIALSLGLVAGWIGSRVLDMTRAAVALRLDRLEALEAKQQKLQENHEAIAKSVNSTVQGLQRHDLQLAQVALHAGVRFEE